MNTVKRWLAGFLSFAMIFTSAAFSNVGALNVFAAPADEAMEAKITITSAAGSEHVYENITSYDTFAADMAYAKAGDTVKVEGSVYVGENINANNLWVFAPTISTNTGVITVDISGASFTAKKGTGYISSGIAAGTGLDAVETNTGIFKFAKIFYSKDNLVVDFPKEYNKDATKKHGVQVSFTLANGGTVPALALDKKTQAGEVILTVNDNVEGNVEPTCTTDGKMSLKATVEGMDYTVNVTKDYGDILAKGHKYGEEKDGVITLPAYRANSNFNYDDPDDWDFGVQIDWAIRGTGANINASQDADGNTIIENIKTRCLNGTHDWDANAANDISKQWETAQVTSISKATGSSASAKNAGSSIYTIGVKTADGIDIIVKQTVYDVPGLGATNIGKIYSVGFETLNYTYVAASNSYVVNTSEGSNGTTWESTLYGSYTDIDTSASAGPKKDGHKYKKTVVADNGDINWKIEYYDAETGVAGGNPVTGTVTGTMSPSTTGTGKTSKIYDCGANTYFYAPIQLKVVVCDGADWTATGSVWNTKILFLDATDGDQAVADTENLADITKVYTAYPEADAKYFKIELDGEHTLDMSRGDVTYTKDPTTYSTGLADIICKHCNKPVKDVEVPMLTEGALYELSDKNIIDEESLSAKAKEATTVLEPTCEDDGYSYYWSVDTTKFLNGENLIPDTTVTDASKIKAGNSQFYKTADDKFAYINSNNVGDAKKAYTDAENRNDVIRVVNKNVSSDNVTAGTYTSDGKHHWKGGKVEITGSKVEKLGHDWYIASSSDVHWIDGMSGNIADAAVTVTIDYTCRNASKNKTGYTAHESGYQDSKYATTNKLSEKQAITYNFAKGTDTDTVKYSAITKSSEPGKDCTVHGSIVYTVKDVTDVFGNAVQYSKEDVKTCGNHDFKDQLNWSDDGKSATVTRTCQNENCLGAGNDANGGYNAKPLVAACTVTKEDQDDGSYLYTASYGGETIGTKKVFDLRDAKAVVNNGEAVDENLYPGVVVEKQIKSAEGVTPVVYETDEEAFTRTMASVTAKQLPSYVITINGKEIDPDLYTFVKGSYTEEANNVASFRIKAADDTDAYDEFTVKYKILNNKMFDGTGEFKVDNGDEKSFDNWRNQIVYDGEKHNLVVTSVDGNGGNEVIKKTTVKYALLTTKEYDNLDESSRKELEALTYADAAEFTEIGDYYVYAKLSADGYTDAYAFVAKVSVVKQYKKTVNVFIDNASVIEGSTPNLHLRVVGAEEGTAEYGEEITFDPADFTVTTVGGEAITNLKVGTYQLVATSEVYQIDWATSQKDHYMGTLTVLAKDGSTAEEQAAAESATALIKALNENSTEADVAAARKAYDALTDVAKARVDADVLKKLTDAEDKIATDKVIAAMNAATTDADKAAAYEAYSKLSDAQKAAVDTAVGKDKVDAAKAAKDAADKKAAEEAAAKKAAEELATAKTAANNALAAAKGYESNAAVKSAIDALNAAVAKNDTAAIKTATTNLNNAVAAAKKEATSGPEKGKTYTVGGQKYLATSTTAVSMQKAKNAKTVTVPATVMINGKKANVTGIKKGAFGKKTKTVNIKSKKLTKKGVKNSLKGSKVKTVKVKCGKSYVKKYKKYFTKKNAGKKVTVK